MNGAAAGMWRRMLQTTSKALEVMIMNARTFRAVAATALALAPVFACAQNVRYEWQGKAYVDAENQLIAERVVNGVIGASPGTGSQVVFFRTDDRLPGELVLGGSDGTLAQLPSGAYYAIAVAPGNHVYSVDGQALSVQVAPGQRSYVRIGDHGSSPRVRASNALTFLRLVTGKREPLYASN
jgi:hypothetical protein